MWSFLEKLFDADAWSPRWQCGLWSTELGWLHIIADLGIWTAYMAIPIVLAYFVIRRRDIPFHRIFWLFCVFIFACGLTHLLEAAAF